MKGEGFLIAMHTLDRSRPTIGAQAVGIAQAAIDFAGNYMKGRKAFGRPIADLQGLRFMLADMAIHTEAARALSTRPARRSTRAIPMAISRIWARRPSPSLPTRR